MSGINLVFFLNFVRKISSDFPTPYKSPCRPSSLIFIFLVLISAKTFTMASSSSSNNNNNDSTGDKADGGRLADFDVSTITKEQLEDLDLRTLKDLAAELHMHKQGSKDELVARILKAQEIFKGKGKKRLADDNDNDNNDNDNDSEDVDDAQIVEPRMTDKESQLSQEELEKLREIIKKRSSTGDKDSDKGMHKKRALSGEIGRAHV